MNRVLRDPYLIVSIVFLLLIVGPVIVGAFIIPRVNPYSEAGYYAAAPYAVPSWASIFYGNLPPNIKIPSTYSLIASKIPEVISFWNLKNETINGDTITVIWNSTFGPEGETFTKTMATYGNTGPGSIEIIIQGGNPLNLTLYHTFLFNYKHPGHHNSFEIQASIYYVSYGANFLFNGYLINPLNESFWMFLTGNIPPTNPVLVTYFHYIGPKGWNYIYASSAAATSTPWIVTSNISYSQIALASVIMLDRAFNVTGNFTPEFVISYEPTSPNSKLVVYLSDLYFEFLGSRYGLLGTDNNGASVFSEYVLGGEFDLILALIVGSAIIGVGAIFGLLAGYYGGGTDQVLVAVTDFILLLPGLAMLIILMTIFQQIFISSNKALLISIVIIVLSWPPTARIIRGQTMAIRNMPFIEAAKALGMTNFQILRKHVARHIVPIIIAQLIFDIPAVIGIESALDFLGVGIMKFPTWGNMLGFSTNAVLYAPYYAWWWILPPGFALLFLGISLFYLGEAIERYYGLLTGEVH